MTSRKEEETAEGNEPDGKGYKDNPTYGIQ